jgi:hypothetical protein
MSSMEICLYGLKQIRDFQKILQRFTLISSVMAVQTSRGAFQKNIL